MGHTYYMCWITLCHGKIICRQQQGQGQENKNPAETSSKSKQPPTPPHVTAAAAAASAGHSGSRHGTVPEYTGILSPNDETNNVRKEPPVVARADAVPDERTVVIESPHTPTAAPTVPRPQRPLDRARVARRAGHGPRPALQPHQARRRVLDVDVAVGHPVSEVFFLEEAGGPLTLLARKNAYPAVERRGHLGVRGVYEPEKIINIYLAP